MALSKFEKDMAVIQKLDDEPNDVGGLTAAELKAKFDEGGEAVKKYLNDTLTPELEQGFSDKVSSSTTINGHPLTGDVTITKSDVELGNVDNTSDLDKPISTAQQKALDTLDKEKADAANVLTKDNHTPYTPTEPDHPATKGYVDETTAGVVMGQLPDGAVTPDKLDRAYLPLSGGTLTGPVTLHGDPQSPLQAAPKQYVDSVRAITRRLPVAPGYSVKAGDVVDVGKLPVTAPISSKAEGSIVYLNEGGKPVEFYVAKHNYESGLNGAGRTLVVRKECYDQRQWHTSNVNAYASSAIDSWLNSTYKNMLDADIRALIGSTKIRYTPGNGNNTMSTLDRAVFLLSAYELGKSESWFNKEGTTLPNAANYQIAKLNGSAVVQWTRSPFTNVTSNTIYLNSGGVVGSGGCTGTYGSRPAFTLPATFPIKVGEGDEAIVKNIEPQANVETTFSDSAISFTTTCSLNTQTSILAYIQSSTAFIRVRLQSGELGSVFGIDNSENIASLSLARINDNQIMVGFVASGTLRTKIATVKGTGFSYGAKRTAINSNLTEGLLIALSETKVLAIANRNGIDARVCTISGTEIDDDTGANHATVPGVTSASNISATLLPDDKSGNKRVCVCFAGDNKGKAVIATIDSTNQVTWGPVVTIASAVGDSISCCSKEDDIYVTYKQSGLWALKLHSSGNKISVAIQSVMLKPNNNTSTLIEVAGRVILIDGTGTCVLSERADTISICGNFAYAGGIANCFSGHGIGGDRFIVSYSDANNSSYGTCTILTVKGDRIAGSFQNKSSQAIALQDGNAGDLIDIIYSGTAELPGTAQGTKIESPGVQGYAPMEGLLEVYPWYGPNTKIATGSYVGTGASGIASKNRLLLPFMPNFIVVQKETDSRIGLGVYEYNDLFFFIRGVTMLESCKGNASDYGQLSVAWVDKEVSWYVSKSSGSADEDNRIQLNTSGDKYRYVAFG